MARQDRGSNPLISTNGRYYVYIALIFLNMKVLRPEVQACLKSNQPGKHGMFDLMDDMFLSFYNVTDDEFDFMLEHATEEEQQIIA